MEQRQRWRLIYIQQANRRRIDNKAATEGRKGHGYKGLDGHPRQAGVQLIGRMAF